jgi:hypothetical protein
VFCVLYHSYIYLKSVVLKMSTGDPCYKNYFHNNTKTPFAFFILFLPQLSSAVFQWLHDIWWLSRLSADSVWDPSCFLLNKTFKESLTSWGKSHFRREQGVVVKLIYWFENPSSGNCCQLNQTKLSRGSTGQPVNLLRKGPVWRTGAERYLKKKQKLWKISIIISQCLVPTLAFYL